LVTVTINGHTYPSAIAARGGKFLIPLSADNRTSAGELPLDFRRALAKHPAARRAYDALSNSRKKQHVVSIEGAKTDETRQRRITKAIEQLEA